MKRINVWPCWSRFGLAGVSLSVGMGFRLQKPTPGPVSLSLPADHNVALNYGFSTMPAVPVTMIPEINDNEVSL